MLLTVQEMEVLCVFHAGTLSATLGSLRDSAAAGKNEKQYRVDDVASLITKLSDMKDGDIAFIAFEPEK